MAIGQKRRRLSTVVFVALLQISAGYRQEDELDQLLLAVDEGNGTQLMQGNSTKTS